MRVTVCYALPECQEVVELEVDAGCTVGAAIARSGLVERHGIDLTTQRVGIHARLKALTDPVAAGDRVEIYRPLLVDAKTLRRRRAAKAAGKGAEAQGAQEAQEASGAGRRGAK